MHLYAVLVNMYIFNFLNHFIYYIKIGKMIYLIAYMRIKYMRNKYMRNKYMRNKYMRIKYMRIKHNSLH